MWIYGGNFDKLPQFAYVSWYLTSFHDYLASLFSFICLFFIYERLAASACLVSFLWLSVVRLPFLKRQGQEARIFSAHYCLCRWLLTRQSDSNPPLTLPCPNRLLHFLCVWLWPKIPTTATSTAPSHALMPHRLSPQIPLIIIPETSVPSCLPRSLVASKGPNCLCSFSFIKTSWKVPAHA